MIYYCYSISIATCFYPLFLQQPQQFVEIIMSSIIERSNKLLHLITVIRTALLEIVNLTAPRTGRETTELHPFMPTLPNRAHNPAESSRSSTAEKHSTTNPDYSNKSTPQRSSCYASGMQSAQHMSSPGTMVFSITPTHDAIGQLGPVVEGVLVHFCEATFDVVNRMVLRSHDLFSGMLWSRSSQLPSGYLLLGEEEQEEEVREAGEQEQERRASRVVSFNVPDSPEKVESLADVLKQDRGQLQAKIESLVTSLYKRLAILIVLLF